MEPDPNKEAIQKQIEARIRKVGTRLGAWAERAQQDKVLANLDANADLYVIADLLRQKLAIEQQMQELRITTNPHYWELTKRVIDMDLTDLEIALRRTAPKSILR
jgi:hypothetical protein